MLGQMNFGAGQQAEGLAQVREGARILREMGEGRASQAEQIASKMEQNMQTNSPSEASSDLAAAMAAMQADQPAEAEAAARAVLAAGGPAEEGAMALLILGSARLQQGDAAGAEAALRDAEQRFSALGNLQGREAAQQGLAALRPGAVPQVQALLQASQPAEALARAEAARSSAEGVERVRLRGFMAVALGALGRFDEALAHAEGARDEAAQAGLEDEVAQLEHLCGQLALQALAAESDEALAEQAESPAQHAELLVQQAMGRALGGDAAGARAAADQAVALVEGLDPPARVNTWLNAAQIYAATGGAAEAEALVARAEVLARSALPQALGPIGELRRHLRPGGGFGRDPGRPRSGQHMAERCPNLRGDRCDCRSRRLAGTGRGAGPLVAAAGARAPRRAAAPAAWGPLTPTARYSPHPPHPPTPPRPPGGAAPHPPPPAAGPSHRAGWQRPPRWRRWWLIAPAPGPHG
jgi:hypothetical protein